MCVKFFRNLISKMGSKKCKYLMYWTLGWDTLTQNSNGAVWISYTNVSSRSEKKELGVYLASRPPWCVSNFYKGIRPEIKGKI